MEPITIGQGFQEYLDTHPEAGTALQSELYVGDDLSYVPTTRGKLEYYKPSNTVTFYPKGQD